MIGDSEIGRQSEMELGQWISTVSLSAKQSFMIVNFCKFLNAGFPMLGFQGKIFVSNVYDFLCISAVHFGSYSNVFSVIIFSNL